MDNKQTKQLTIKGNYDITKVDQVTKMAKILKEHIVKNKLYVPIAQKNYVMVEGWQFAGGLLGLFPRITEVKELGSGKWMTKAEIIDKNDKTISIGYAICSKEELKKKSFDEYAILSMAQTRAIGKAYRNLIGWVMKLAGYESTPSEEMISGGTIANEIKVVQLKGSTSRVETLKAMLPGETDIQKLAAFKRITKINIDSLDVTEEYAARLIGELLKIQAMANKKNGGTKTIQR